MPRYRMSNGTHASDGTALNAPMVGTRNALATLERPTRDPRTSPMLAPATKPISTRCTEIPTYGPSCPRAARSMPASQTLVGDGSRYAGTSPVAEMNCQPPSSSTGATKPRAITHRFE